ncbi:Uu.00g014140.m01.CDS01 [Anthostomella pinea]|uniref:Uu.00g014140.m01.CDS01 n=1 Tax=Anthostomella pinea TaxID=933095 RepID=A0AAI8YQC8_9PEZI|nr:Uu.00g014140.m01.CDS01 [Anthostomella pinea]
MDGINTETSGFTTELVIAAVCSVVGVIVFLGVILFLALRWTRVAPHVTPDSWKTPQSEKSWPMARDSWSQPMISPVPLPTTSPRASRTISDVMFEREKAWPKMRDSVESSWSSPLISPVASPITSPRASPRASRTSSDVMLKKGSY